MARRKKSSVSPTAIISIIAAVAVGAGAIVFFKGKGADPFDGLTKLDAGDYLTNPTSVSGNSYQLTGTVTEKLKQTDEGRLFSLAAKPLNGGEPMPVGIFFPAKFSAENILVGQEFTIKIEVKNNGLLEVKELKRS